MSWRRCDGPTSMSRRIVVTEFVTLDGVMEDPGGAEGAPFGGWAFTFDRGDAGNRFKLDELLSADAQLLGRKTYEGFAAAWPSRTDTTVIGIDDVESLDGAILVAGSHRLVQGLLERQLVDEVRLVLYPTALGAGKKLFDVPADFTLVSAEPSAQVVLLVYERA
jgi:dihydrofolate reductase